MSRRKVSSGVPIANSIAIYGSTLYVAVIQIRREDKPGFASVECMRPQTRGAKCEDIENAFFTLPLVTLLSCCTHHSIFLSK